MKRLALIVAFLLAGLSHAWADKAGSTSSSFLKMGVGGRGLAMGDAQTAAVDDVMSLYWNPAGLGFLFQNEVGFMHNTYVQGIDQDVLYYARPTQTAGTWGVGLSLLRVSGIEGFDDLGAPTGDVSASDSMLTVGWGKSMENLPLFRGARLGANVKVLRKSLDDVSGTGYMADLGFLYEARGTFLRGLNTGFVVQNFGVGPSFDGQSQDLPLSLKLGFAYPLFGDNLVMAMDTVMISGEDLSLNFGADYRLWDILGVRLGYKGNNDLDTGLTYGVRLGNERLHVDYAFAPFGPFGDSHRVSLGFRFGKAYRENQVADQVELAFQRAQAKYGQGYLVDAYMQSTQILEVAPWHRPSKLLAKRIQDEFKAMESESRRAQLQAQVDEHFARGEQFFQVDDLLRAKREFDAILALQPDHMGAKTYLNRIDERFKGIVDNFFDLAVRAFASEDYNQAQEYLEKVVAVNPDHAEARKLMDNVKMLVDQVNLRVEAQARKEKIDPLRATGEALFKQGQYEDALRQFDQILSIDSTDSEAIRYKGLARNLVAKESFSGALAAARNADYNEAYRLAKKAQRYNPDDPEINDLVNKLAGETVRENKLKSQQAYRDALDAFLNNDLDRARDLAQEALDLDNENQEAKRLLERLGRAGTPQ